MIAPIIFVVLSIWLWRRSDPVARRNAQVAGYRFVQRWPPAVCSVNPSLCHGIVQRFTIHGLWPYDSNGASITGCVGSAYNFSLVSSKLVLIPYLHCDKNILILTSSKQKFVVRKLLNIYE